MDDALAGAILPTDDSASITSGGFVECELPTPDELQDKLGPNAAMTALDVAPPDGRCG